MDHLLQQLVWFLPWCWFVNMTLTVLEFVVRNVPWLDVRDRPLDRGIMLRDGNRLLGDSTTPGGLVFILIVGLSGEAIYPGHHFLILAILVKVGDMLGSFIKRRLGVPRGGFVPVLDHGDYILVAGAYAVLKGALSIQALAACWIFTLVLTPAITWIAFTLSIRRVPL